MYTTFTYSSCTTFWVWVSLRKLTKYNWTVHSFLILLFFNYTYSHKKKEFICKNYLFLWTRMLETDVLSDSKLLCRLTVIFRFNSIHRYDVASNIVADKLQKSERFRESWPHVGPTHYSCGPTYYSGGTHVGLTYYSGGTHVLFRRDPRGAHGSIKWASLS